MEANIKCRLISITTVQPTRRLSWRERTRETGIRLSLVRMEFYMPLIFLKTFIFQACMSWGGVRTVRLSPGFGEKELPMSPLQSQGEVRLCIAIFAATGWEIFSVISFTRG